jgi:hypothetical protein
MPCAARTVLGTGVRSCRNGLESRRLQDDAVCRESQRLRHAGVLYRRVCHRVFRLRSSVGGSSHARPPNSCFNRSTCGSACDVVHSSTVAQQFRATHQGSAAETGACWSRCAWGADVRVKMLHSTITTAFVLRTRVAAFE